MAKQNTAPEVDAVVNAQFATAHTIRSVVSLLIGGMWLVGGFIASIAMSVDERLRCATTSSSSYCYESDGQMLPIIAGLGVFVLGVIIAIVFSVKANNASTAAEQASQETGTQQEDAPSI